MRSNILIISVVVISYQLLTPECAPLFDRPIIKWYKEVYGRNPVPYQIEKTREHGKETEMDIINPVMENDLRKNQAAEKSSEEIELADDIPQTDHPTQSEINLNRAIKDNLKGSYPNLFQSDVGAEKVNLRRETLFDEESQINGERVMVTPTPIPYLVTKTPMRTNIDKQGVPKQDLRRTNRNMIQVYCTTKECNEKMRILQSMLRPGYLSQTGTMP